eukprot:c15202_g1_i1 orf=186-758(-)
MQAFTGMRDHAPSMAAAGGSAGYAGETVMRPMPNYFYMGRNVQLLFWEWAPSSGLTYALSLVAVLILAVFYEWLGELRRRSLALLHPPPPSWRPSFSSASKVEDSTSAHQPKEEVQASWRVKMSEVMRGRQVRLAVVTLAYVVHSAAGYVVLLVVMSFNAGVFLSILAGLGLGFYLFRLNHLTNFPQDAI